MDDEQARSDLARGLARKYNDVEDVVDHLYRCCAVLTMEWTAANFNERGKLFPRVEGASIDVASAASEAMLQASKFRRELISILAEHEAKARSEIAGLKENLERAQSECRRLMYEVSKTAGRTKEVRPSDPDVRSAVLEMSGRKCFYCKVDLADPTDLLGEKAKFHVDHLVPKASGGPDTLANFVASCPACNMSKSDSHVVQFMRRKAGNA